MEEVARKMGVSPTELKTALAVPETTLFSQFVNPVTGEEIDTAIFTDPMADTEEEAIKKIYNQGLRDSIEESMNS